MLHVLIKFYVFKACEVLLAYSSPPFLLTIDINKTFDLI